MARVLLIEDNDDIAMLFEMVLAQAGHEVRRVDTLAGASSELATGWSQAVLSDLRLPDGYALDWVGDARQAHPTVSFAAMSSTNDASVAARAMKAGFDRFIDKGSDLTLIEAAFREL